MKVVGIFEAKTHLSEICEEVATSREPVTVTKRGKPLVRIEPVETQSMTVKERREAYMASRGRDEEDDAVDFEGPPRPSDVAEFMIKD